MSNIDKFYSDNAAIFSKSYIHHLKQILDRVNVDEISSFIRLLIDARKNERNIFFIGNGGSAATASHFANDISIGTLAKNPPFRALSLTDNLPVITAIANDFGYEYIFSKQLEVAGRAGDILVAISASGNSKNLIHAIDAAKKMGITTVAVTGFSGGLIREMADKSIHIQTDIGEYGPVEDVHMILDHLIGSYLMRLIKCE